MVKTSSKDPFSRAMAKKLSNARLAEVELLWQLRAVGDQLNQDNMTMYIPVMSTIVVILLADDLPTADLHRPGRMLPGVWVINEIKVFRQQPAGR